MTRQTSMLSEEPGMSCKHDKRMINRLLHVSDVSCTSITAQIVPVTLWLVVQTRTKSRDNNEIKTPSEN